MAASNRNLLFQESIFRCRLFSFRGCEIPEFCRSPQWFVANFPVKVSTLLKHSMQLYHLIKGNNKRISLDLFVRWLEKIKQIPQMVF